MPDPKPIFPSSFRAVQIVLTGRISLDKVYSPAAPSYPGSPRADVVVFAGHPPGG